MKRPWKWLTPKSSITRRWIMNGFSVIAALLVVFGVASLFAFRTYYYQNVQTVLYTRAGWLSNALSEYVRDASFDFEASARGFLDEFAEPDRMEMQILNASGHAVMSSTGFLPDGKNMTDYQNALESPDDIGTWQGTNVGGENVMALSLLVRDRNKTAVGAIRYIVSLSGVDAQVRVIGMLILLIGLLILFLVLLSGSFFVSSIVMPVTDIARAARHIALGDYHYRLGKQRDDELGDLCDTINYMAQEIVAADAMKNEFISTVSHELRTPLTAIKGWSETLKSDGIDPETMRCGLSVIENETDRLAGIVEQLLDFSRLQSGHIPMDFRSTDMAAELQDVVLLFAERARRNNITLEFVPPPTAATVSADRDRIRRVFINLLDNALKYTAPGGRIRVEAAVTEASVQVVVSDNGVGISREDLPHVKEKFFKANKTRPGSGIGLALADEIVTQHKGTLTIESEPGVGTNVIVTLPLAATEKD